MQPTFIDANDPAIRERVEAQMDQVTVKLELTKLDALAVLGAVEDGALSWRMQAAISTGDEKTYAELRARTLHAKAVLIGKALYPETYDREAVA